MKAVIGGIVLVLAAGLWLRVSTPDEVVLGDDCQPAGTLAALRAELQGRAFWQNQANHVDQRIDAFRQMPTLLAKVDGIIAANKQMADDAMKDLYSKHPELRQSRGGQVTAEAQPQTSAPLQGDRTLEDMRLAELRKWSECRRSIELRLGR